MSVPFGQTLESTPRGSGVYRIFDRNGELIVLDKTSNLFERLDRYFVERSEPGKDLDLRGITSRIEYRRTWSPFETAYVLYVERRRFFPRTYRKMRTFRTFTLMKINRKQRFPRIYASRNIKPGVDYFGPFPNHAQFLRLKSALERAFKLRPCLYNIRGDDPYPDCMYFQMRTCSRPCNNDITRAAYLADIEDAMHFIQGHDELLSAALVRQIEEFSSEERFEEAELLRRRLDKIRAARKDIKETFTSIRAFNCLVLLASESTTRARIACVRAGSVVAMKDYAVAQVPEDLPIDLAACFETPARPVNPDWQYDEFCLVSQFMLDPLKSVEVTAYVGIEETMQKVAAWISRRKKQPGGAAAELST